jgi:hypothetical protein
MWLTPSFTRHLTISSEAFIVLCQPPVVGGHIRFSAELNRLGAFRKFKFQRFPREMEVGEFQKVATGLVIFVSAILMDKAAG